ncbi:MAG: glycerate kinase, partial [Bacteroides sp.]
MKRIVIAADSFKGSLTSIEVAHAVERGIRHVFPNCDVVKLSIADGGEGTTTALLSSLGGTWVTASAHDPLMRPIEATYGLIEATQTAVIEMATASGLMLLSDEERNPMLTTTFGTGELVKDALKRGYRRFMMGIGGSATNDAGLGMMQALGYRFFDSKGNELGYGGQILSQIARIDASRVLPELHEATFTIACDVANPFSGAQGAAHIFARQKGADDRMVEELDAGLRHLSAVLKESLGIDIDKLPGAGAAGGMGGGLVAFLSAKLQSGIDTLLSAIDFESRIQQTDLIITGEGKMDAQTVMGKAPEGILRIA